MMVTRHTELMDEPMLAARKSQEKVDSSRYVNALADLQPAYMNPVVTLDAWGNPYVYTISGNQRNYTLTSNGRDGAAGPGPPVPWFNEPFEPDIILADGEFTQMPTSQ